METIQYDESDKAVSAMRVAIECKLLLNMEEKLERTVLRLEEAMQAKERAEKRLEAITTGVVIASQHLVNEGYLHYDKVLHVCSGCYKIKTMDGMEESPLPRLCMQCRNRNLRVFLKHRIK